MSQELTKTQEFCFWVAIAICAIVGSLSFVTVGFVVLVVGITSMLLLWIAKVPHRIFHGILGHLRQARES